MGKTTSLTETIWTRVDPATKKALEVRADKDDRTVAQVIRAAIRSHLAKGSK
jgi:predicted transcriptional regulator